MKLKNPKKMRSKRGLTLVEIVIGVTLVVIVFASTLGAMVGGFTTTIYNADENRAAVLNASMNEVIMNTVHNKALTNISDYHDMVDNIATKTAAQNVLVSAVTATIPEAQYVEPVLDSGIYKAQFKDQIDASGTDYSYQYTLIPDVKTTLTAPDRSKATGAMKNNTVEGVTIKTCFYSAGGPVIYESFVPYAK